MNLVLGVQQKIINGVELFDQIILAIQKFKKKKKKKKKNYFIIYKKKGRLTELSKKKKVDQGSNYF